MVRYRQCPTSVLALFLVVLAPAAAFGRTAAAPVRAPAPPARRVADDPNVQKALDQYHDWLKGHLQKVNVPGASVAFVHRGQLVSVKAIGQSDLASGRQAHVEDLYPVASISKLFLMVAVGQLVEQGKLSLDDPVSKHLPYFKPKSNDPKDPDRWKRVTVKHLLTHTSGLWRDAGPGLEMWSGGRFWDRGEFPTTKEIRAGARRWKLVAAPGSDLKYSNLGMAQMAEIVSKVSGIPYEDYVTRSILKPLALDHTSANIPADREPRAATGYGAPDKAGQRPSMPIIRSAGGYHGAVGIQTTAEDLGRFASWLMGAGEHDPVLKRSTLDAFQKLQAITKSDLGEGHGVVYMMRKRNDGVTVGHTGTLIGHRSALIMDPKHKTAFVVLTNAVDTNREAITDEAQRQVFPAIVKATPPAEKPAPGKLRHPAFARHLGTYQKVGGNEQKVVAVDAQGNLTIDGARLVKTPGKRRTFDQPGQSYTDRKGETVTFAPGATHSSLSPTFEFESGGVVWKRVP